MKHIINIRSITSLIVLMALATSCCNCILPTPPKKQDTTEVVQKNTFRAKFSVSSDSFPARGGKGAIKGILQELSSEGKVIKETPLKDEEYSVSLKIGDSKELILDNATKTFTLPENIYTLYIHSKIFEIEAIVTGGKAKGCKQIIPIKRGKYVFTFTAEPNTFTSKGGSGKVIGKMLDTDFDGHIVEERALGDPNFGLSVIDNPEGITIDYLEKTFTVAEGGPATFKLQATTGYGQPQVLEIKREG